MNNPIGWFEIYVDDMSRAKTFYETVLSVSLTSMVDPVDGFSMYGFPSDMESYGSSGALVSSPAVKAGNNSTVVYFSCEDCATEASRVVEAGGVLEREKFAIGEYGFVSLAKDTEGNLIGLHSLK